MQPTPNYLSIPKHLLDGIAMGFCAGWAIGSTSIAGGKLYTVLLAPEKKVHEVLGHFGKPSFRRELCVTGATALCVTRTCSLIGEMFDLNFFKGLGTAAAGCIACAVSYNYADYANYDVLKAVVITYVVVRLAGRILNRALPPAPPSPVPVRA